MHSKFNLSNIVSSIEKDEQQTKKIISLIDNLQIQSTDIKNKKINILTLMWKILNDYYEELHKCIDTDSLKKILKQRKIILIKNHIYLDITNYIQYKCEINKFYKYILTLAENILESPSLIDKEEIIKKIKSIENGSLYNLLLIPDFATKLQNIVYLPRIKLYSGFETNRMPDELKNENFKKINNLIYFLFSCISELEIKKWEYKNFFIKVFKYIKRKKITISITILLVLFSAIFEIHKYHFVSILDIDKNIILENINYNHQNKSLNFFVKNNTSQKIRILNISVERKNITIANKEMNLKILPYNTEELYINNIEVLSSDIIKVKILINSSNKVINITKIKQ